MIENIYKLWVCISYIDRLLQKKTYINRYIQEIKEQNDEVIDQVG